MTCIAWDGNTLAGDKRMNTPCGPGATVTKIKTLSNGGMVGWAGGVSFAQAICRWIDAGADPESAQDVWFEHEECAAIVLFIAPDSSIWLYEHVYPIQIHDPFYAIGTGAPYAVAAMECGRTAEQAVAVASKYDTTCGHGIDTLQLVD